MSSLATYQDLVAPFSARHLYRSTLQFRGCVLGARPGRSENSESDLPIPPIPPSGVTFISGGPEQSKSLWWVDTMASYSAQREEFVAALARHEIPHPLAAPLSISKALTQPVHLAAPEQLLAESESVAAALDLVSSMIGALQASRTVKCPKCGTHVRRHHSWSNLLEELASILSEESKRSNEVSIELHGDSERLSVWCERRGLTPTQTSDSGAFLVLDTYTVQPEEAHQAARSCIGRIADLLPTLRQDTRTWITVRGRDSGTSLALAGYCGSCDYLLPAVSRAALRAIISHLGLPEDDAETNTALSLAIGETQLRDLLSSPLSRLSALSPPLPEWLREPLCELIEVGAAHVSLSMPLSELAPADLAAVSLVRALRRRDAQGGIVVADLPLQIFPPETHNSVHSYIVRRSSYAPTIVLSQPLAGAGTPTAPEKPHPTRERALPASDATCVIGQFPRMERTSYLLIERLGLYESLIKLFLAGHDARAAGINAKQFSLRGGSKKHSLCSSCLGIGLILANVPNSPRPHVTLCDACGGRRFIPPVRDLTFRGRTVWELLNSPFADVAESLRALPRAQRLLDILSTLAIDYLPLGMPLRLLSSSERRLVTIASAVLEATASKPALIRVPAPAIGLSDRHYQGLLTLMRSPDKTPHVAWCR